MYFWGHDLPPNPNYSVPTDGLDGVYYLTEFHKRLFYEWQPRFKGIPFTISGNGIVPDHFELTKKIDQWIGHYPQDMNLALQVATDETLTEIEYSTRKPKPFECVYMSNWARGLETNLDIWDDIHKEFPHATLRIFYGDETWGNWTPTKLLQVKQRMRQLEYKGSHQIILLNANRGEQ